LFCGDEGGTKNWINKIHTKKILHLTYSKSTSFFDFRLLTYRIIKNDIWFRICLELPRFILCLYKYFLSKPLLKKIEKIANYIEPREERKKERILQSLRNATIFVLHVTGEVRKKIDCQYF